MRVVAIVGAVKEWAAPDAHVRRILAAEDLLVRGEVLLVLAPKPTRRDAAAWAVVRVADKFQVAYEWRERVNLFDDPPRPDVLLALPGPGTLAAPGHRAVYDAVLLARMHGLTVRIHPHPGADPALADTGLRDAERRQRVAAT